MLKVFSVQTFRDVALNPEEYRFMDIVKPYNTIREHGSHRELTRIENENIEATSPPQNFARETYASVSEVFL